MRSRSANPNTPGRGWGWSSWSDMAARHRNEHGHRREVATHLQLRDLSHENPARPARPGARAGGGGGGGGRGGGERPAPPPNPPPPPPGAKGGEPGAGTPPATRTRRR